MRYDVKVVFRKSYNMQPKVVKDCLTAKYFAEDQTLIIQTGQKTIFILRDAMMFWEISEHKEVE